MATSIGSGIGGYLLGATQGTYGGTPVFTSARTFGTMKSFKPTINIHPFQGGPYLRNGEIFNLGTTRLILWQDATATLMGDMATIGQAMLVNAALAPAAATLTALGTTTAYGLGGATGISAGAPDTNLTLIDMQAGVPTSDGTLNGQTYHSGIITKAVWTFDRAGLVSYEYDLDFQYMETATALTVASEPAGPIGFTMYSTAGGGSTFKVGTYGAEAAIPSIRKCTITLERKMNLDRIYVGQQYKSLPVTNDKALITVSIEADYSPQGKTALFDIFPAGTPLSIVAAAIGPQIGTSGYYNTFQLNPTNCFVDTGGEAPLDGPDLVKNTLSLSGTIDAAGDSALKALLYTADTGF